jgi:hypothetical protein
MPRTNPNFKHGLSRTPEDRAFVNAKFRCRNPNAPNYAYYGGRGIEFRFKSIQDLIDDIGRRPSPDHQLDRIDNDGHYEAGNVRWATREEQQNNVRRNRPIELDGVTMNVKQWSKHLGVRMGTLMHRTRQGWCDRCILTKPLKPGVKQSCQCTKDLTGKN